MFTCNNTNGVLFVTHDSMKKPKHTKDKDHTIPHLKGPGEVLQPHLLGHNSDCIMTNFGL